MQVPSTRSAVFQTKSIMFLLSSSSTAIKIIEFLLDKTLWKYFDKANAKHSVESDGNGSSKILLFSNVNLKDDISLGTFRYVSIKEYVLLLLELLHDWDGNLTREIGCDSQSTQFKILRSP